MKIFSLQFAVLNLLLILFLIAGWSDQSLIQVSIASVSLGANLRTVWIKLFGGYQWN